MMIEDKYLKGRSEKRRDGRKKGLATVHFDELSVTRTFVSVNNFF